MKPAYSIEDASPACTVETQVSRALAGDGQAERALYETHVDRVYGLALRMTRDEDLAREYTQEAFTRAFRRLDTFRGDSSFGTWLHRVTVNVTLSGLQKVRRTRAVEQDLDVAAPALTHACRLDSDPMLRRRLRDALGSLPELYRVVVVMHDLEGFTHEQIGQSLNIPAGTSKARLSRARARLRPLLSECALDYATC